MQGVALRLQLSVLHLYATCESVYGCCSLGWWAVAVY